VSGNAVGGLPGGCRLVELIDEVTGGPGAIREIATRWTGAGSVTDAAGSALRGSTGGVDGAWQGAAADAFVGYLNGFTSLCGGTRGRLDSAAGVLEQAATLLETTKRTVENRCDALVSEAACVRAAASPETPPDQVQARIAALVDEVYGELRPIVVDANSQLAGLAGQLTGLAGDGEGFARYPSPDTAAFVPQPGRPIGWDPELAGPSSGDATPASSAQHAGNAPPTGNAGCGPTGNAGGEATGHAGGGPTGHAGGGATGGYSDGGGSAAGAAGGSGSSGPPPPGGGPAPRGQVAEWIRQAIEILKARGYPVDKMNPNDIWMIIQHESGGDPHAINNWDSNAAKGTPSKGLMQTIDPTFNAHALPGHTDIYNPVDNIIAGIRYAIDRYGSVSNVPGVVGTKSGTGYRGY